MMRTALWTAVTSILLPGIALAYEFRDDVDVAPGGTLDVRLVGGSVEVDTHDEDRVSIDATGSAPCELRADGRDASIVCGPRGIALSRPSVRLRVRVPERYSVRVKTAAGGIEIGELDGDVEAATTAGRIEVEGARGWVSLRTSAGSVRVENVHGDLRVHTNGGSIRASDVTGRVDAEANGGRILLDEVGGPVEARATGGSMDVRFVSDPEGSLETIGGSIEVEFPEESEVTLDAHTLGGSIDVESDLGLSHHPSGGVLGAALDHLRGEINGGGRELRLRTRGGSIRVTAR